MSVNTEFCICSVISTCVERKACSIQRVLYTKRFVYIDVVVVLQSIQMKLYAKLEHLQKGAEYYECIVANPNVYA